MQKNDEGLKFEVGDCIRILKHKSIFAKGYTWSWSEEVPVIQKVKNNVLWTYAISDTNGEETFGTFYEKESQKTN